MRKGLKVCYLVYGLQSRVVATEIMPCAYQLFRWTTNTQDNEVREETVVDKQFVQHVDAFLNLSDDQVADESVFDMHGHHQVSLVHKV